MSEVSFDQTVEVFRSVPPFQGTRPRDPGNVRPPLILLRRERERQAREIEGSPEHVFTTLDGKSVSPRTVQQMVERYVRKAGITKDIHPHSPSGTPSPPASCGRHTTSALSRRPSGTLP